MNLLNPLALALGLLSIPIILLYMLRLRRREQMVSSTLLWQKALQDYEANRPWQRLRRNWLLLLQLLALLCLVVALARPFQRAPGVTSGQLVILLDASASMQATDVAPSRFALAQAEALTLIDTLGDEAEATVILVADQPRQLISATTDKRALRLAIENATVTPSEADWNATFALASAAARSADQVTTVIISDGGVPSQVTVPTTGELRYVPIGTSDDNIGVGALALRATNGDQPQLLASIENYSATDKDATLSLFLDDELFHARQITVAANSTETVVMDAWPASVLRAELSPLSGSDQLDIFEVDNIAWTVYRAPVTGGVLYISENGNLFVEQVLAALPQVAAFRANDANTLPEEAFDVYIFDGVVPAEWPDGETLLINPPAGNALIDVAELRAVAGATDVQQAEHPIQRFLDWRDVQFGAYSPLQLDPASALQPIVTLNGEPIVAAGTLNRRRVAVLGFDIRQTDLPLQVAFPILFSNLIEWLTPSTVIDAAGDIVRPGDAVTIRPDIAADEIAILPPDAEPIFVPASASEIVFADTETLGVYWVAAGNPETDTLVDGNFFAVNLYSTLESNIAPKSELPVIQAALANSDADQNTGRVEFWRWLGALAGMVMLLEWWWYQRQRQVTLPHSSWWRRWRLGRTS